jgi:hypothetical protein
MEFAGFTPFHMEDVKSNRSNPFISAGGHILNKGWCKTPTYQRVDWNKIQENYTPMTFNTDPTAVPKNIATIQKMQKDLNKTGAQLQKNYYIVTNDVNKNISSRQYLQENNSKYHYNDIQDPNVILRPQESKDIKVAIQQDIQQMKLYQNSIYIVSVIAGATLLIATIILVKNKVL